MAVVRLSRKECQAENLPPVCMVCGESSDRNDILHAFYWTPDWARLVGWWGGFLCSPLLFSLLFVKRRRLVATPLCEDHENYWLMRGAMKAMLYAALSSLFIAPVILNLSGFAVEIIISISAITVATLIILGGILHFSVRSDEIEDTTMRIVNVDARFETALNELRESRVGDPITDFLARETEMIENPPEPHRNPFDFGTP